jgi:hypothetical protein
MLGEATTRLRVSNPTSKAREAACEQRARYEQRNRDRHLRGHEHGLRPDLALRAGGSGGFIFEGSRDVGARGAKRRQAAEEQRHAADDQRGESEDPEVDTHRR